MSDSVESSRVVAMEVQLNEHSLQIQSIGERQTTLESSFLGIKETLNKIQNTIRIAGAVLGIVIAAGGIGGPLINSATSHSGEGESAKVLKELLQMVLTSQLGKASPTLEP